MSERQHLILKEAMRMNIRGKGLLIAVVALALAIPSVALAADATKTTTTKDAATVKSEGMGKHGHGKMHGKMHGKGHGPMGGPGKGHGKGVMLGAPAHMEQYISLLTAKYAANLTADWEKAFAERAALAKEFEALKANGKPPAKPATPPSDKLTPEQHKAQHEAKRALHEAFQTAVTNKDAVAIKTSLTNLLADFKAETAQMKERLAVIKSAK
jgi:hypothetical protein